GTCRIQFLLSIVPQSGKMARADNEEALDGRERCDATAGAHSSAVERGGGAGEVELLRQKPALQKSVDEAGVKQIARTSGIHHVKMKGGRVVELRAVPGEHAVDAEGNGG